MNTSKWAQLEINKYLESDMKRFGPDFPHPIFCLRSHNLLFSAFLTYAMPLLRHTFPLCKSFVTNASSMVPSGPGPTSQMDVSSSLPGFTGDEKRTPKSLRALGSPPAAALSTALAAKPKLDNPCRMTPPNPPAWPIRGSVSRYE